MDKNEIKRANRKALPQFMLIMVICFIIGGNNRLLLGKIRAEHAGGRNENRRNVFWDMVW